MKKIIFTFLVLILNSFLVLLVAQTVEFSYDNSGNVTSRKIIVLKSASFVSDTLPIIMEDVQINVKIYPNPTSGNLKIEIPDFKDNDNILFQIYDLNGRLVMKSKGAGISNMLDLSRFANGTYILQMTRNNRSSSWRIIKTN